MKFSKNMIVNEIMETSDAAMKILTEFDIDTCCGAHKTLEEGAQAANVNIDLVLEKLNQI